MKKLITIITILAVTMLYTPVFASGTGRHSNTKGKGHTTHKGKGLGHSKTSSKKVKKTSYQVHRSRLRKSKTKEPRCKYKHREYKKSKYKKSRYRQNRGY